MLCHGHGRWIVHIIDQFHNMPYRVSFPRARGTFSLDQGALVRILDASKNVKRCFMYRSLLYTIFSVSLSKMWPNSTGSRGFPVEDVWALSTGNFWNKLPGQALDPFARRQSPDRRVKLCAGGESILTTDKIRAVFIRLFSNCGKGLFDKCNHAINLMYCTYSSSTVLCSVLFHHVCECFKCLLGAAQHRHFHHVSKCRGIQC